ncbi:MAG: hypothetical protein JKX73_09075 [Flavobacteriales bacterium]|nr:hypothetical protein [Flavobacteriales bacterium]
MRMLNINLRYAALAVSLFIAVNVQAKDKLDEFSKTWSKSFEVNADATLDLDNKYGNIHITTWKQNEISVVVTISVDVSSQEKADRALKDVVIVDDASLEKVMLVTRINTESGIKLNKKLHINYDVKMPVGNNLKLVNKFGDVYINELDGRADLKVAYGNLKCDVLNNPNNRIKLSFSSGKCWIGDFTSGSIEMKYSKLSVNKADKLNLDSKFSSFRIGSATTMDCKSQYDKMEIERVGDLELDGKFSGYEIGTVVRKLDLDIQYSGCEVNRITSLASEITVENSFGGVELCFDEGTSYQLEAKGEFGGIDYPNRLTSLTTDESKSNSFFLVGVVGDKKSPDASVTIATKFGSVELSYK